MGGAKTSGYRVESALPAVILGGGLSERMGYPKVKMARNGRPLLAQMQDRLMESGWFLDCVIVGSEELLKWVAKTLSGTISGVSIINNLTPEKGMISSLRLAVRRAAKADYNGFLAWPIDHPLINVETLLAIRAAARTDHIVVPVFENIRGHPTWWGKHYWPLLKSPAADQGANRVLPPEGRGLVTISGEDKGVLINLNYPSKAEEFGITIATG